MKSVVVLNAFQFPRLPRNSPHFVHKNTATKHQIPQKAQQKRTKILQATPRKKMPILKP
jgi:hypothetical protein